MTGITAIMSMTTMAAALPSSQLVNSWLKNSIADHVGVEVAVGHDVDDVEDLHHADQHGDEDRDDRAPDLRDDHPEEDLPLARAVDPGRLERVVRARP